MGISKALVVDDSRLARVALTKLLTKRGLDVDTAASGGEALDYLRDGSPDVVFIDYMMPDMDGFQAAEAINRLRGQGALPLVMYTSQDTPEDRRRARDLSICGFLTKPTSEEGLDAVLDQVDDWHASASELGAEEEADAESDFDELSTEFPASGADAEPDERSGGGRGRGAPIPDLFAPPRPTERTRPVDSDAGPATTADNSEQRIRQIADQVARDTLDSVRGEWQQQFHELAIELQESTTEAAALASREASDRMGREALGDLHQEWERLQGELHQAAVSGAEKAARGIADGVARNVAEGIAESAARRIATQLVEEFASQWDSDPVAGIRADDVDARITAALQSAVNELAADETFQGQVVAVVSDQGVPLLKNALDHWVRDVAAEAADEAVRDAVIRGTDALVKEAVVASAQAAAREARKLNRRGRILGIAAWLVLAAGVGLALALSV